MTATNSEIQLTATFHRNIDDELLDTPVTMTAPLREYKLSIEQGYACPPYSTTATLDNVFSGNSLPVFRSGIITCGNCPLAENENCPYARAVSVVTDNEEYSLEDATFLPLCPLHTSHDVEEYHGEETDPATVATGEYTDQPTIAYILH